MSSSIRPFTARLMPLAGLASILALGACARSAPPPQPVTTTAAVVRTQAPVERHFVTPQPHRVTDEPPAAPATAETRASWDARYPAASHDLVRWTSTYPKAATELEDWGESDPDQARAFVEWAASHPYEDVGSFLVTRQGWGKFDAIRARHPAAIDELVAWCRRSRDAAEEFVSRATGFASLPEASR